MKILITGSEGFIGQHLVNLLKKNHEIFEFDKKKDKNLLLLGDLALAFGQFRPEIVIHLASNVSNDINDCRDDIIALLNLLAFCKEFEVKKFIFTSSAAVYGNSFPAEIPINAYGISKFQCEQWINLYPIQYNILRLSNVYGLNGRGVVNEFIKNIQNKQPLTIYGDGHQIRDYIYIDDIANIIEKCLLYNYSGTFDIGTGVGSEIWDIINALNKRPLTIFHHPLQQEEIRKSILKSNDFDLFVMNGFYNFISLQEGIKQLWQQMK